MIGAFVSGRSVIRDGRSHDNLVDGANQIELIEAVGTEHAGLSFILYNNITINTHHS